MDDDRMIRAFLVDDAPPSAEVVAEGRRRLYAAAPPARRPRRRPAWSLGAAGLAAAAACAATVVTLGGGDPAPPGGRTLTASQVLLAAAHEAETAPPGRYWHSHVVAGQTYRVDQGGYAIVGARMEIDGWAARSPRDADVTRSRFAGARPQTAADRAAWARAGSPKTWRVRSNGSLIVQRAADQPWDVRRTSPAAKKAREAFFADQAERCAKTRDCPPSEPSAAQREAFAGDPKALRAYLDAATGQGGPSGMLRNAAGLLTQPGSGKLHGAVFRLLAGLPGIRNAGRTTDSEGRPALALSARDARLDTRLLLEPGTYRVLGLQDVLVTGTEGLKPGTVYRQDVYLKLGWTDEAP
ncbi:hypothetical protein [Actinomadura macrotermitis]|uniref:CU044_5270 family protein n=1 Tax=Actinomadura macrotermitis TaxID=2585200 RepID=A0A7K0BUA2_9ACTN|nr:hypothetical protein [Actinomadura macrotermitis]MQY04731.1 hypothetical protein [Actinomadura macrotermitis]